MAVDVHRAVGTPEILRHVAPDDCRLRVPQHEQRPHGAHEFPTDDERSLGQWLVELESLGLVQRDRSDGKLWRLCPEN